MSDLIAMWGGVMAISFIASFLFSAAIVSAEEHKWSECFGWIVLGILATIGLLWVVFVYGLKE